MTILGIDLGTTNSACAIWRDGKAELIPNRFGDLLTPSVVGLDDNGEILVGKFAKQRLLSHPQLCASVFKRYMGADTQMEIGNKRFTAPELSALVLKSLKQDAETHLGETVTEAVISVPAYFNDVQRKATRLAGELAGLKVERLVNEPTAAAMAYGLHEKPEGSRFMVLDLGGGTFDVSIMEYFSGVLEVHASAGDNFLGGEDFLETLTQWYLELSGIEKSALDLLQVQQLYSTLEIAKRKLSSAEEVKVEPVIPQQKETITFKREQFNQRAHPLLSRIQLPIERALNDAGLGAVDLDDVVLVGGATRMQIFRSMIARMFRRMPAANLDPDLVVAMGAAIQAGLKARDAALDDIVLTDVCPYTLGTGVHNENDQGGKQGSLFLPIIERNSVVPVSVVKTLFTIRDDQTRILVDVYQGESRLTRNNIKLGEMEVPIPRNKSGQESIDVRFSYDMNGLLEVDVKINSTGEKHNLLIKNSAHHLSDADIAKTREKLAALKFHPREDEVNRALLHRAEKMFESSLGEKREHLSHLLEHFEAVLEGQNPQEIKQAQVQFRTLLDELEGENWF